MYDSNGMIETVCARSTNHKPQKQMKEQMNCKPLRTESKP